MNLVDNGIKKVLSIERISTEMEQCFLVKFVDHYNQTREKKFLSIKNIDKKVWSE